MDRLRRNSYKRCAKLSKLRKDRIHRFHLADAKRAPAATKETDHKRPAFQQFRRVNPFAILILQFKGRRTIARLERTFYFPRLLQFFNCTFVRSAYIGRDVLSDEL